MAVTSVCFDIGIPYLAYGSITRRAQGCVKCSQVWQDVFALWHRHTKFWHTGVSPCDNILYIFLTLVWPWLLTYMWVAGFILSELYSQFLSCYPTYPWSFVAYNLLSTSITPVPPYLILSIKVFLLMLFLYPNEI